MYDTKYTRTCNINMYLIIPEHEDILVSQKHLEGVDSLLSDQHSHLLLHLLAPPSHSNMEGVVTADLGIRPATPSIIHLQQALILRTKNKVNCSRENTNTCILLIVTLDDMNIL